MDDRDPIDSQPEPIPHDADIVAPEAGARSVRSGAVARISVAILSEPDVVLDDPPAIFGGASHTW
jgi:hypothetical protein